MVRGTRRPRSGLVELYSGLAGLSYAVVLRKAPELRVQAWSLTLLRLFIKYINPTLQLALWPAFVPQLI
jgi:hypothetical protein